MSEKFDNTNRGSAWLSKQKYPDGPRTAGAIKGKGKPDYNGSVNIEGREYFFDMWLRPDDSTNPKAPAFTFKVKAKDAQPEGHPDRFRNEPAGSATPFSMTTSHSPQSFVEAVQRHWPGSELTYNGPKR